METFSQHTTDQPTATRNGEAASQAWSDLSQPFYNLYSMVERGKPSTTIQALYMPSVEEFFTETY